MRSESKNRSTVTLAGIVVGLLMASAGYAMDAKFVADLAYAHAPVLHQDVDTTGKHSLGGKSDFVTAIDFDGDWDTSNNWENIERKTPLAACYYSVSETATHWFILYCFYHPRDWADDPLTEVFGIKTFEHENDLEGLLAIVKRPTASGENRFGEVQAIVTVFHTDFFSYVPAASPLTSADEDIDGELLLEDVAGIARPVVAQEAKGHGLKATPYVDVEGDGIAYYPSKGTITPPTSTNDRSVPYALVYIFARGGLWDRRNDPVTFGSYGNFRGGANAPWGWNDHNDGPIMTGEIATDPVKLAQRYFHFPVFSTEYSFNPYDSAQ
jgi:hypothetical protein